MVISDTHNFSFDESLSGGFELPLPEVDVLPHCGDLTQCGGISSYKKVLKMLGSIDAELKLVIAGNHDIDLDQNWWMTHLDDDDDDDDDGEGGGLATDPNQNEAAIKIMTDPLAAQAGVTYLNEGTHSFTLKSGAQFSVYASPYTPAFCDWAFPYAHHEDRFNPPTSTSHIPANVDIVMTHGPLAHILDACPWKPNGAGCPHLLSAIQRVRPRLHCFGHIHLGYGAALLDHSAAASGGGGGPAVEVISDIAFPDAIDFAELAGHETLMLNAAIWDGEGRPVNRPWLVDLPLPLRMG